MPPLWLAPRPGGLAVSAPNPETVILAIEDARDFVMQHRVLDEHMRDIDARLSKGETVWMNAAPVRPIADAYEIIEGLTEALDALLASLAATTAERDEAARWATKHADRIEALKTALLAANQTNQELIEVLQEIAAEAWHNDEPDIERWAREALLAANRG